MKGASVRTLVKGAVPPVLLSLYRRVRYGYVWNGVYRTYLDVPRRGDPFSDEDWVRQLRVESEKLLEANKAPTTIPIDIADEQILLPVLVSLACHPHGTITVLDFGGGLGSDYIRVLHSAVGCHSINYYVVETRRLCGEGSALFSSDDRIHFSTALPEGLVGLDIVYINSALQYIQDYESLLKKLCSYQARYFLFSRLAAGDIPTYACAQRVAGGMTPYWFINVKEILDVMSANGYLLVFKSGSGPRRDQSNLLSEFRLPRSCNLLFRLNADRAEEPIVLDSRMGGRGEEHR